MDIHFIVSNFSISKTKTFKCVEYMIWTQYNNKKISNTDIVVHKRKVCENKNKSEQEYIEETKKKKKKEYKNGRKQCII